MANFFQRIAMSMQRPSVEYSAFDMSHEHKTTMPFGKLIPILFQEVLPGDKWNIDMAAFARTLPLVSPMMHKVDLKVRFFFVPNRLVWKDWENFIAGRKVDGRELYVPELVFSDKNKYIEASRRGSLLDYFGVSINPKLQQQFEYPTEISLSQLPFRAYDLIWREYFANQYVHTEVVQDNEGYYDRHWTNRMGWIRRAGRFDDQDYEDVMIQGATEEQLSNALYCEDVCFEPDYFTAACPVPNASYDGGAMTPVAVPIGGNHVINDTLYPTQKGGANTGVNVTELRQALRLQEFLEKTLHTGQRYIEQLFGHFGVESSDARLQRPEYLGGGSIPLQVSEVMSTFEQEGGASLGELAGRGLLAGRIDDINLTSEEHGMLFGLAYIVPRTSYYGGIPRTFLRRDRFDFAWPEFAALGDQPVYAKELDASAPDNEIYGYVPRYSEYKQCLDKFSGYMVDNLAHWHLGRDFFGQKPKLNKDMVYIGDKAREALNRVFVVTDTNEHQFQCAFGFNINAYRPLPYNPLTLG